MGERRSLRTPFSLVGRVRSVGYAFSGVGFMLRTQHSTWFHLCMSVALVALCLWLGVSPADWRWIVLALSLIWAAETTNTAVEKACDAVTLAYRPVIKHAKDIAAGAVLVSALGATAIVALTVWPYLHRFLHR